MIRSLMSTEHEADYLVVDQFLSRLLPARVLRSAFDLGVIDALGRAGEATADRLALLTSDRFALDLLLATLAANGVVETGPSDRHGWSLTGEFRRALRYRDILEAKLDFALLATADLADRFDELLADSGSFLAQSRLRQLFAYDRCYDATPENLEHTRQWMKVATALTRYESTACLRRFDFADHQHLLDIGGSSGEFALQVCRRHHHLRATVLDLPVVCLLGGQHVRPFAESDRIRFVSGNVLCDAWPTDVDVVSFKSMLHDWPDDLARQMLEGAVRALPTGGRVLIYERARIAQPDRYLAFHSLPMLLCFRSFRHPEFYATELQRLGCDVAVQWLELELPFFIVSGCKTSD